MWTQHMHNTIRKFAPLSIINNFLEVYSLNHGDIKTKQLIEKVENSQKTMEYLLFIVRKQRKPNPKELIGVLNCISFFIFSKAETICAGGLVFYELWRYEIDPDLDIMDEQEVTDMYINLILECKKMKLNILENFFDRFFSRMLEIASQAKD